MNRAPNPPDLDPSVVRRVTAELAALHDLGTAALRERYLELYGEPTRSRNAAWLRKKLAWRIQELAYGGLSENCLQRIDEVLAWMDDHQRNPIGEGRRLGTLPPREAPKTQRHRLLVNRDRRLPPPGTTLFRRFKGRTYEVEVLAEGFIHAGTTYDSLSEVARVITGTRWNGFRFFKLTEPWTEGERGAA